MIPWPSVRSASTVLFDPFVQRLSSVLLYSLWSSHEDVDQAPDPTSEGDDDDPDDLVVSLGRLFGGAIHDGPNPQDSPPHTEYKDHKNEEQFKDAHISFLPSNVLNERTDEGGHTRFIC